MWKSKNINKYGIVCQANVFLFLVESDYKFLIYLKLFPLINVKIWFLCKMKLWCLMQKVHSQNIQIICINVHRFAKFWVGVLTIVRSSVSVEFIVFTLSITLQFHLVIQEPCNSKVSWNTVLCLYGRNSPFDFWSSSSKLKNRGVQIWKRPFC